MSEPTTAPAAPPPPPLLAALKLLHLIGDDERAAFFHAVAAVLTTAATAATAAADLGARFGLDFASGGEPERLLIGVKLLLCRIASRAYGDAGAPAALRADLCAAGLAKAAAEWVAEAAEAAALPCAAELRSAQAHAASALSHAYLEDFDWQLNYVLGSSTLASVRAPLVALQLRIRKAGSGEEFTEHLELDAAELDQTVATLSAARSALQGLPQPAE